MGDMVRIKALLFLFALVLTLPLAASREADSLKTAIRKTRPDTNRFNLLYALWLEQKLNDVQGATITADSALSLAKQIGYIRGIARSSMMLANLKQSIGRYSEARPLMITALGIARQLGDSSYAGAIYSSIANNYLYQEDDTQALKYYFMAMELAEKSNDQETRAVCLENIGIVYADEGQYDKARSYFSKSLAIHLKMKEDIQIARSYNNLGTLALHLNKLDSTIYYYEKSIQIRQKIGDLPGLASSYSNMASVLKSQKKYEKALEYANKSIELRIRMQDKDGLSETYIQTGTIYQQLKEPQTAITYFLKALENNGPNGSLEARESAYLNLSETYHTMGEMKNAYEYHRQYMAVHDSLYNEGRSKQMNEMASKYESDKKQKELEILQQDEQLKNLQVQKEQSLINYSIAGLLLVLLMLGVLYSRFALKKKANEQLAVINSQIARQNEEIEDKNTSITDSIRYAQRIQGAMLPSGNELARYFKGGFVFYRPKSIVSGDIYWMFGKEGDTYLATLDATGAGVPGALLSIICYNALNEIVSEMNIRDTGLILDQLHRKVLQTLNEDITARVSQESIDIALVKVSADKKHLQFSGASASMIVANKGGLRKLKGDIYSIGGVKDIDSGSFSTTSVELEAGTRLYLYTDGFSTQFGGPKGKKLNAVRFRQMLSSCQHLTMHEQDLFIEKYFDDWKGDQSQTDDALVLGVAV